MITLITFNESTYHKIRRVYQAVVASMGRKVFTEADIPLIVDSVVDRIPEFDVGQVLTVVVILLGEKPIRAITDGWSGGPWGFIERLEAHQEAVQILMHERTLRLMFEK